jgi:hypothetical protein
MAKDVTTLNVVAAVGEVSVYINVFLSTILAALLTYMAVSFALQPPLEDQGTIIRSQVTGVNDDCDNWSCTIDVAFTFNDKKYAATIPSMTRPKEGDVVDVVLLNDGKVRMNGEPIPVTEYKNYATLGSMALLSALVVCGIAGILSKFVVESKPFQAGAGILTFLQGLSLLV